MKTGILRDNWLSAFIFLVVMPVFLYFTYDRVGGSQIYIALLYAAALLYTCYAIKGAHYFRAIFFVLCQMVTLIICCALAYRASGLIDSEGHVVNDLYSCIYFSIVTWTTLGYGDFAPGHYIRFLAAFEALLEYIYMGVLIALVFKALNPRKDSTE